jgi:hypothetical protein
MRDKGLRHATHGMAGSGRSARSQANQEHKSGEAKSSNSSRKTTNSAKHGQSIDHPKSISMPKGRADPSESLLKTRLKGERWREQSLHDLSRMSTKNEWSEEQCHIAALDAAIDVALAHKLNTRGAVNNLVNDLRLAGHSEVRDEFERLLAVRDEVWAVDPAFLRATLHGPSQVFVDLMRRQRNRSERRHTANAKTYLRYLRRRFA